MCACFCLTVYVLGVCVVVRSVFCCRLFVLCVCFCVLFLFACRLFCDLLVFGPPGSCFVSVVVCSLCWPFFSDHVFLKKKYCYSCVLFVVVVVVCVVVVFFVCFCFFFTMFISLYCLCLVAL